LDLSQSSLDNPHKENRLKTDFLYSQVLKFIQFNITSIIPMNNLQKKSSYCNHFALSDGQMLELINSLPICICYMDNEQKYRFANQSYEDLSGLKLKDLYGKHLKDVIGEVAYKIALPYIKRALAGEKVQYEVEYPYRNQTCYGSSTLVPNQDQNGQIRGYYVYIEDIKEQKQTKEALKRSEELYRTVINVMSEGIIIYNNQGEVISANPRALEILELSKSQLIGNFSLDSYWDIMDEKGKPLSGEQHPFRITLKTGRPCHKVVMGLKKPDHSPIWLSFNSEPLVSSKASYHYGVVVSFADITQRKKVEIKLRQSELKLRQITNSIPGAVYQYKKDKNGQNCIQFISNGIEKLYEISAQEIMKNPQLLSDFILPEDLNNVNYSIDQTVENIDLWHHEYRIKTKSDQIKWICGEAIPYVQENGEVVWNGLLTDITEHKKIEEDLKKAKEQAESANQSKSVFLANMSHELRSPLNAILGFTQLLGKSFNLTSKQRKKVEIINRSGEQLLSLINDILALTKVETDSIFIQNNEFNLLHIIDSIKELFEIKAKEKYLDFKVIIDPKLPRHIEGDRLKIRQILINLITNAIKYTFKGKVSCEFKYEIDKNNQPLIVAKIEDTGVGISEDEINSIFEPFMQTKSGKDSQVGTGLGLAITYQYLQLLGGKIEVKSVINQGSIFTVKIPLKPVFKQDPFSEISAQKVIGLAPDQELYRILIVDDDLINRELIKELIGELNFEIAEGTNGKEAIEKQVSFQPHLIFMDIKMPILNGIEATKIIKQKMQEKGEFYPKIVALTASAFEEEKNHILHFCDSIIIKPITENELLSQLRQQLGLVYQYEKQEEKHQNMNNNTISQNLLTIDSVLVTNLKRAVLTLDQYKIKTIITQIKSQNKTLASQLSEHISEYNYEVILSIIDEVI